ncbi:MAG: aldo/keto reductase [Acidobacteriota bacterium]|nr:aldo/keto reductase [Acidobacteriota bacterium]
MSQFTRRDFLATSIAAGAAAAALPTSAANAATSHAATDLVTLGKSGQKVTRLAFGTGSRNGYVQYSLGQKEFSRLVAYAYERGIRFFETAEAYMTPAMLGEALKPYPRDSYQLMSKVTTDPGVDPAARFDEMLRIHKTDYFDIMLLHWQHTGDWVETTKPWQEGIVAAQEKKIVKTRGCSVHGLPALREVPKFNWLEVAMIRMNHKGTIMDGSVADNGQPGNVPEVVSHVQQVKKEGMGVISMKLVGEGHFTQRSDRQEALRFAFRHAGVDAVTIGFKNTQEIDEAIENINMAYA